MSPGVMAPGADNVTEGEGHGAQILPLADTADPELDTDEAIVDAVQRIAEARGVAMAQIAMAWVLKNPVVTAPIIGATKPHHLTDAVAAFHIELTDDEVAALEQPYVRPPASPPTSDVPILMRSRT